MSWAIAAVSFPRDRKKERSLENRSLSHEIDERNEAERELNRVQRELIQTAKLAGVGQMAATLAHEINQPLAAIETYAANTTRALGRQEIADSNLHRITAMVARISDAFGSPAGVFKKAGHKDESRAGEGGARRSADPHPGADRTA